MLHFSNSCSYLLESHCRTKEHFTNSSASWCILKNQRSDFPRANIVSNHKVQSINTTRDFKSFRKKSTVGPPNFIFLHLKLKSGHPWCHTVLDSVKKERWLTTTCAWPTSRQPTSHHTVHAVSLLFDRSCHKSRPLLVVPSAALCGRSAIGAPSLTLSPPSLLCHLSAISILWLPFPPLLLSPTHCCSACSCCSA